MRYLMREGAPLTGEQWDLIDKAVIAEASRTLVGRRFLDVTVVGPQVQNVPLDRMTTTEGASADFWGRGDNGSVGVASREFLELMNVYADFGMSWRDVDGTQEAGVQAARDAAVMVARREDDLIFHGDANLEIEGIFTVKGANEIKISDWSEGEGPVRDIAAAIEALTAKGGSGSHALVVSTDLYAKLHRIQAGTGMMEVERVKSLVGKLFASPRLHPNSACMVFCDPQNMDLVVGQDIITGYTGNEKMDQTFRVMETVVPRFKRPAAIAVIR